MRKENLRKIWKWMDEEESPRPGYRHMAIFVGAEGWTVSECCSVGASCSESQVIPPSEIAEAISEWLGVSQSPTPYGEWRGERYLSGWSTCDIYQLILID